MLKVKPCVCSGTEQTKKKKKTIQMIVTPGKFVWKEKKWRQWERDEYPDCLTKWHNIKMNTDLL